MKTSNFGATKKRQHPESMVCIALWKWFQYKYPKYQCRYLRLEVGGQRTKIAQSILKAEGNKAGTSDVFIAIPNDEFGGLWLEVKADKGRMSTMQRRFQAELGNDYLCRTGYGVDECTQIITHYMASCGLLRGFLP